MAFGTGAKAAFAGFEAAAPGMSCNGARRRNSGLSEELLPAHAVTASCCVDDGQRVSPQSP